MTKDNYERLKLTTLVILVFSLIILVIGVTYAVCSNLLLGTTDNILEAGTLSFSFNEDAFVGNGINIQDAMPLTDESGKVLNSTSQYFDFSVNAIATIAPLYYQILAVKQDSSTLSEESVKLYLTLRNGSEESPSPLTEKDSRVLTYSEYSSTSDNTGKVLYNGIVPQASSEYTQNFRLRMWVSEETIIDGDYAGKNFSIKVRVVASE